MGSFIPVCRENVHTGDGIQEKNNSAVKKQMFFQLNLKIEKK